MRRDCRMNRGSLLRGRGRSIQYINISEIYLGSVFVLMTLAVNRLPACGDLCRLLIIFSSNSDRAQDQHSIGPDLDPNCWTSDSVPK